MNKNNKNINLTRKNSILGLKHLQSTLDDFFNDLWWPTRTENLLEGFQPLSKLSEDKDNYYLEVDLPGTKKEEVEIEVENNILRIHGERKETKEDQRRHYSEIFYGSFTRDYNLPNAVDSSKIKARYENGVLTVTIPKSSESKTREVKVE